MPTVFKFVNEDGDSDSTDLSDSEFVEIPFSQVNRRLKEAEEAVRDMKSKLFIEKFRADCLVTHLKELKEFYEKKDNKDYTKITELERLMEEMETSHQLSIKEALDEISDLRTENGKMKDRIQELEQQTAEDQKQMQAIQLLALEEAERKREMAEKNYELEEELKVFMEGNRKVEEAMNEMASKNSKLEKEVKETRANQICAKENLVVMRQKNEDLKFGLRLLNAISGYGKHTIEEDPTVDDSYVPHLVHSYERESSTVDKKEQQSSLLGETSAPKGNEIGETSQLRQEGGLEHPGMIPDGYDLDMNRLVPYSDPEEEEWAALPHWYKK